MERYLCLPYRSLRSESLTVAVTRFLVERGASFLTERLVKRKNGRLHWGTSRLFYPDGYRCSINEEPAPDYWEPTSPRERDLK